MKFKMNDMVRIVRTNGVWDGVEARVIGVAFMSPVDATYIIGTNIIGFKDGSKFYVEDFGYSSAIIFTEHCLELIK